MFTVLKRTTGIQSAFLLMGESNLFFSDEQSMSKDSPELQVFMESTRFVKILENERDAWGFKLGHWKFEDYNISFYAINNAKLMLFHSNEIHGNEFDEIILDILSTL